MLRSTWLVTAILVAFAACSDTPAAPEIGGSTDVLASPDVVPVTGTLSGFLNGPAAAGGSGVIRIEGTTVVFSSDPARDILALHAQGDDLSICGGSSGAPVAEIQLVENQETFIRRLAQLKDAPIFLYRLSDPEPDDCIFFNENWLYKGTHSLVATDNNFDAFLNETGANAFGWRANGTVYDPDGNRCKYHEHQNAVWSPDRLVFTWLNEDITVNCQGPR